MHAPQHSPLPALPLVQAEVELPADAPTLVPRGLVARRTVRQRFLLRHGYHPLSPVVKGRTLRLQPDAPPGDDRKAPGPRCGGCQFIAGQDDLPGSPLKCWFNRGERVTRGSATDIRAWWPACQTYQAHAE